MIQSELQAALEAILMVIEEPVSPGVLAQITEVSVEEIEQTLVRLRQDYQDRGHGFELRNIAGGWRFYSSPAQAVM